ncbi:MAG: GGDEF domain-containing protein [Candidatus Competibacteraceae bacterium]|nr:MAG: GGDEF domain-containing protein [Candidatus Competibacteraceae bacterium]
MLTTINTVLARWSRAQVFALALGGVLLIGLVDYLTGYELGVSLLYLVPIDVAAWNVGRRAGFGMAVLSAIVWFAADWGAGHSYSHLAIPLWNTLIRLGFFLSNVFLLAELREHLTNEQRLARMDALTGVFNSRAFTEQLEYNLGLARRNGSTLTLAYIDLDDFKRINDRHGHGEGDRLLRVVGQTLRRGTRRTDRVARLGGDEFALLLPDTDAGGAVEVIGKARHLLRESLDAAGFPVTCSVGAVTFQQAPSSADEAVKAADHLMYQVKSQGKDAVAFGVIGPDGGAIQPGAAPIPQDPLA